MKELGFKFPCVAEENGRLYVKSSHRDFEEDLVVRDGIKWRPWDSGRSKVAAGISKNISQLGIKEGDTVLYLGAAHGYTPSFIADMVGEKGTVFCVEFSPIVTRELLVRSRARTNLIPILADARHIEEYSWRVTGADVVIMDIAQRDQVRIFKQACQHFLKEGGFGILALKARSVDTSKQPREIFAQTFQKLEEMFPVVDYRTLEPFERDHALYVIKKNSQHTAPSKENSNKSTDASTKKEMILNKIKSVKAQRSGNAHSENTSRRRR